MPTVENIKYGPINRIKWRIPNFSKRAELDDPEKKVVLRSNMFTIRDKGIQCELIYAPAKGKDEDGKDSGMFLEIINMGKRKNIELVYKFWIENTEGERMEETEGKGLITIQR
jgi:hypothetical protein